MTVRNECRVQDGVTLHVLRNVELGARCVCGQKIVVQREKGIALSDSPSDYGTQLELWKQPRPRVLA